MIVFSLPSFETHELSFFSKIYTFVTLFTRMMKMLMPKIIMFWIPLFFHISCWVCFKVISRFMMNLKICSMLYQLDFNYSIQFNIHASHLINGLCCFVNLGYIDFCYFSKIKYHQDHLRQVYYFYCLHLLRKVKQLIIVVTNCL